MNKFSFIALKVYKETIKNIVYKKKSIFDKIEYYKISIKMTETDGF